MIRFRLPGASTRGPRRPARGRRAERDATTAGAAPGEKAGARPGGGGSQRAAAAGDGRPPRRRRCRLHQLAALPVIALLLLGSAGLRMGTGSGQALARGIGQILPVAGSGAGHDGGKAPAAGCPADPELAPILARLTEREAKLKQDEAKLDERRAALDAAGQRMQARLDQLKAAEQRLTSTMERASTAAETDLGQLTSVYESMKPKQAVPLFEAMEPSFAAGFLARMRPEEAAAVMAGMAPERAYAISVILAGRNAEVPVPKTDGTRPKL